MLICVLVLLMVVWARGVIVWLHNLASRVLFVLALTYAKRSSIASSEY